MRDLRGTIAGLKNGLFSRVRDCGTVFDIYIPYIKVCVYINAGKLWQK